MSKNYNRLRKWSDETLPIVIKTIQEVLKPDNISIASDDEDINNCTDLVVDDSIRFAVRIRTFENERYKDVVTIRNCVEFNSVTEFDKFIKNPPDIIFYGVTDFNQTGLAHWRIIDGKGFASALKDSPLKQWMNDDKTGWVELDLNHFKHLVIFSYSDDNRIVKQKSKRFKQIIQNI